MDFYYGMLIQKKAKFVQVENDYGFKVVNVENGVIKIK